VSATVFTAIVFREHPDASRASRTRRARIGVLIV
jgi:hypothetical protein